MAKSSTNPVSIVVLGILIAIVVGLLFYSQGWVSLDFDKTPSERSTTNEQMQPAGPTPTPTPTSLKQGKETYIYSWGEGTTIPKLNAIEIDPHDPKVGQTQTVSVKFTHTSGINSVSMMLFSDNKSTSFPMTLAAGTETDGTWTGSWKIDDTVLYRYDLQVHAKVNGRDIPYDVILRGSKP